MAAMRGVLVVFALACVGLAVWQLSTIPNVGIPASTPDVSTETQDELIGTPVASSSSSAQHAGDRGAASDASHQQQHMATYTKTVLTPGSGPKPLPKQYVTVSADLYLANPDGTPGQGIWSTHKPSGFLFAANSGPQPFEYQAGVGGVVPGWEDGVASMQLGESARLNIPWKYAYGASGHPGFKIPPQADLVFDITVLAIK